MVYYNEIDRNKAAWLRELIKAGAIADGEVDERSIVDVRPDDLNGFTQWHCFAGIGIWSYALRLAGWPDEREVFTFSCPCQPFSAAGKREGFADRRHLWPECFRLIRERKPIVCFGEQVQSPDGLTWLDLVSTDMESVAYTIGATGICSASVGSPHARNRLFFVADTGHRTFGVGSRSAWGDDSERTSERCGFGEDGATIGVADTNKAGPQGYRRSIGLDCAEGREDSERHYGASVPVGGMGNSMRGRLNGRQFGTTRSASGSNATEWCKSGIKIARPGNASGLDDSTEARFAGDRFSGADRETRHDSRLQKPSGRGASSGMGDAEGNGRRGRQDDSNGWWRECPSGQAGQTSSVGNSDSLRMQRTGREECQPDAAGPVNGYWGDAKWIYCRDDKWRPVESTSLRLDDVAAADLGRVCVPCGGSPEGAEVFFPLIHKGKARVQRLRGYGDGIVAELAAEFIRAYIAEERW